MKKIEKSKYQGYLWYSDEKEPEIYQNRELEIDLNDQSNPFIIEGQLCDGKKSYSIKYVDGHYILKTFQLNNYLNEDTVINKYQPNWSEKDKENSSVISQLIFIQYWHPAADKNCEDMKVLQPGESIFVGFNESMIK